MIPKLASWWDGSRGEVSLGSRDAEAVAAAIHRRPEWEQTPIQFDTPCPSCVRMTRMEQLIRKIHTMTGELVRELEAR